MSTLTLIRSLIELKSNEKKSRDEILRLQEKKVRKLLKYAYKNSKFYHDLYASHGIKNKDLETIDISKIPTVGKDILMNNFDDVVTVEDVRKEEIMSFLDVSKNPSDLFKNKYHVIHTSGSSGKIGIYLYNNKEYDYLYPGITRALNLRFKRIKSAFFGVIDGHYSVISYISWGMRGVRRLFNKTLILDIKKPLANQIKTLNDYQPDILSGYFTGLILLAEQQEKGNLNINPETIINVGESVNPNNKKYIEKIFQSPVVNLYGTAECCYLGVGKNEYGGIVLFDDFALIEIKENHYLLTNLYNKTQPIIRYRINDYLNIKKDVKNFLPFTVVDEIVGRAELVVWFKNKDGIKDFIHPIVFVEFYVKGLDKFQILIKDAKSFDFLAVINDNKKEEVIDKIKKKLDKILSLKNFTDVCYSVKVVDDISIDNKIGKFKLIVKNNH